MDFLQKLDATLGFNKDFDPLKPLHESTGLRSDWMTADDDVVEKIAYSSSKAEVQRALKKFAKSIDDPALYAQAENGDPDTLKDARKEARRWAQERGIVRKNLDSHDTFGMSKDDVAKKREEIRQKKEEEGKNKQWPGDTVYAIFDQNGNQVKMQFDGQDMSTFPNKETAEMEQLNLVGDPKHPDAELYTIRPIQNNRNYTALKQTYSPLKSGWTKEEVIMALKPLIRKFAYEYASPKLPVEDLFNVGAMSVLRALETDAASPTAGVEGKHSPFGKYVVKRIRGDMHRAALTQGVVQGADDSLSTGGIRVSNTGKGGFGQQGGLTAFAVFWTDKDGKKHEENFPASPSESGGRRANDPGFKQAAELYKKIKASGIQPGLREIRGVATSADRQVGTGEGEGATLGSMIRSSVKTPAQIAAVRDDLRTLMASMEPRTIKTSSGIPIEDPKRLSRQQKLALTKVFGLDNPESMEGGIDWRGSEEHEPGAQSGKEATPVTTPTGITDKFRDKVDPKTGKTIPFHAPTVRSFADVAKEIGIGPEAVRDHVKKALTKLYKAAEERRSNYNNNKKFPQTPISSRGGFDPNMPEGDKEVASRVASRTPSQDYSAETPSFPRHSKEDEEKKKLEATAAESISYDRLCMLESFLRGMVVKSEFGLMLD